jgi:hypothetical protein
MTLTTIKELFTNGTKRITNGRTGRHRRRIEIQNAVDLSKAKHPSRARHLPRQQAPVEGDYRRVVINKTNQNK